MATPWRDREQLAALVAAWRDRAAGQPVYRIATGAGWVSVSIAGDERDALFLGAMPGAVLAFPFRAPLPEPLRQDLRLTRRDPLLDVLRDAVFQDAHLLADDIVLELTLDTAAGLRRLRHQLFGQRGGIVVLDSSGRMLWTAYPSPHPCLVDPDSRPGPDTAPGDGIDAWSAAGLVHLARQRETALGDRLRRGLARRLAAADRLVANLAADLDRADGGHERRREAEALAAHLHTVTRGTETVTVADPRDGTPLTIALDPALPPHANLERLFRQARKGERGREVIADRLADTRSEQARITTAVGELEPLLAGPEPTGGDPLDTCFARLTALQAFDQTHGQLLAVRTRGKGRAPDEPTRPFRRYRIDDRWDVWVGRSREENDELTHRASHARDLWLHAQGVGGSHVILRTGGRPDTVPRSVLEKAAALAALHSKARNSSLVPVIWTERRYVRRPRKAPPGTAVCLRDENLFVEPGVMTGVEPA